MSSSDSYCQARLATTDGDLQHYRQAVVQDACLLVGSATAGGPTDLGSVPKTHLDVKRRGGKSVILLLDLHHTICKRDTLKHRTGSHSIRPGVQHLTRLLASQLPLHLRLLHEHACTSCLGHILIHGVHLWMMTILSTQCLKADIYFIFSYDLGTWSSR